MCCFFFLSVEVSTYFQNYLQFFKKINNYRPEATAYDRLKASKQRYDVEHAIDEELSASRQRASKAIREEPIYEPRRSKLADMDGEFDEQVGRVSKIMIL